MILAVAENARIPQLLAHLPIFARFQAATLPRAANSLIRSATMETHALMTPVLEETASTLTLQSSAWCATAPRAHGIILALRKHVSTTNALL